MALPIGLELKTGRKSSVGGQVKLGAERIEMVSVDAKQV
jgi:hypothetical protein